MSTTSSHILMENNFMNRLLGEIEGSGQQSKFYTFAGILVLIYFLSYLKGLTAEGVKAPVAGYKSFFEPEWLLRMRFPWCSREIIYDGYDKFKDGMYKILRNDSDILVISSKYLKQIGNLMDEHSSSSVGQIRNMAGRWCTADIIVKSDLHFRIIQQVLTPNLNSTIPMVNDEIIDALSAEMPDCKGKWVETKPFELLSLIIARVTGRVFVGLDACRDPDWIKVSLDYDINVGTTVVFLRMFPPFLHPVIARLLPSYWRSLDNIKTAEKIIGPLVRKRKALEAQGGAYEKPKDLLQWMMDEAEGKDGDPNSLPLRQLVVNLAALHTTSMATTHAIYDLCQNPQYFEPLRKEILTVLRADMGWQKTTLNKLKLLDSFIKETQRFSPASLMSFNRYLRKPFTLDDGTNLPAGTHLCMAAEPILQDPAIVPGGNPTEFDPFRFSKWRDAQTNPDNANRNQLVSVDSTNLHFGAGRYGCPGRFFASEVIKMMFAHMLLRYDFSFAEGKGRPKNFSADENIFPDPEGTLLVRERENPEKDLDNILAVGGDLEEWHGLKA